MDISLYTMSVSILAQAHCVYSFCGLSETTVFGSITSMAPKKTASVNAAELQSQYGDLLCQPPFSDCVSPYQLHQALKTRQPPIGVSFGVVRQWWWRVYFASQQSAQNAQEFEDKYGGMAKSLVAENPTAYKLRNALRIQDPAVIVSHGILKAWLLAYGGQDQVQYTASSSSSSSAVCKRPATVLKRPAAVQYRLLDENLTPVTDRMGTS